MIWSIKNKQNKTITTVIHFMVWICNEKFSVNIICSLPQVVSWVYWKQEWLVWWMEGMERLCLLWIDVYYSMYTDTSFRALHPHYDDNWHESAYSYYWFSLWKGNDNKPLQQSNVQRVRSHRHNFAKEYRKCWNIRFNRKTSRRSAENLSFSRWVCVHVQNKVTVIAQYRREIRFAGTCYASFHTNFAPVNLRPDSHFKALKDRKWRSFLRLTAVNTKTASLKYTISLAIRSWALLSYPCFLYRGLSVTRTLGTSKLALTRTKSDFLWKQMKLRSQVKYSQNFLSPPKGSRTHELPGAGWMP